MAMRVGSLYWPTRTLTAPFRRSWFDLDFVGLENIPRTGPVVLAPNHISFLDSFLIMYSAPRKILFAGKAEYLDSWKTAIFPACGMIPVDRSGKGLRGSITALSDVLDKGGAVGIFPEGTRSRSGSIGPGHPGAAHLAMGTGAALIPVGIIGTDRIQPPGSKFPRRGGQVTIRIGRPMDLGAHAPSPAGRRALTEELMRAIAVLASRPYSRGSPRDLAQPHRTGGVLPTPGR